GRGGRPGDEERGARGQVSGIDAGIGAHEIERADALLDRRTEGARRFEYADIEGPGRVHSAEPLVGWRGAGVGRYGLKILQVEGVQTRSRLLDRPDGYPFDHSAQTDSLLSSYPH